MNPVAIAAFIATVLGLFFSFNIIPGVGSFAGSVLLVIGGTVLTCQFLAR
jgi:hypothetical protein